MRGLKTPLIYLVLLAILGMVGSCLPLKEGEGRKSSSSSTTDDNVDAGEDSPRSLDNPVAENSSAAPSVEIRHFVDPLDGAFRTKVTVPKNFSGLLYLSGLNFSTLSNRLVSVKFSFGRSLEPVIVPALVGRASGLTPQTNIDVLTLDMSRKPFENIRLIYDLFDYSTSSSSAPIQDPRDVNLYCRGLSLSHDPTFLQTSSNSQCDATNEKCLYAYAKIVDQGMVDPSNIAVNPSEMNIDLSSTQAGYNSDSASDMLKKCLADNGYVGGDGAGTNLQVGGANLALNAAAILSNAVQYTYQGPYRRINESNWEISSNAVDTGSYGLFENNGFNGTLSFMFPRAAKINLGSGIQHLSSTTSQQTPGTTRSLATLLTPGETEWMDGCNARVQSRDQSGTALNAESISSCNVTAKVEVITVDPITDAETIISTSLEVKLQLVRASELNSVGEDVLYSNFNSCSSSNACAGDECCFNSRCWSKSLVSQCREDAQTTGDLPVGNSCTTDLECSSLCCDASTGLCQAHNTQLDPAVLCSKPPGSTCIAKEWCLKEVVRECLIIDTGLNSLNQRTCALRCYNRLSHGECKSDVVGTPATCRPPDPFPVPAFDPNNPDCSNAQPPPAF